MIEVPGRTIIVIIKKVRFRLIRIRIMERIRNRRRRTHSRPVIMGFIIWGYEPQVSTGRVWMDFVGYFEPEPVSGGGST